LTNNKKSIKLSDSRKCADLEQLLHQAVNKLSSAQLIIYLFNKEHNQDTMDTTISQQLRTDLEQNDKWTLVTPRRPKVKIGDKNKNMEKVSECTVQQILILRNPYLALEVDSDIIRSDVKTNIVILIYIVILTITKKITSISQ
jgi:murein L,D-transpeptidase YcbB/YkuD